MAHGADRTDQGSTAFFTFEVGGKHVGYVEIRQSRYELYTNAWFPEGEAAPTSHEFRVRLEGGVPVAAQGPSSEWREVPAGTWPSSAWPLVLRTEPSSYECFDEGSGSVFTMTVRRDSDLLVEYRDGRAARKFGSEDGEFVYVQWGEGVESRRVASMAGALPVA